MKYLYIALYTEGKTDDLFLPALIQRTAQKIVGEIKGEPVDVQDVFLVKIAEESRQGAEQILQAARIAHNYDVLIVHQDADTQTHNDVLATRLEPGRRLIEQMPAAEKVCRCIVPLIPVKMTEAWMLADWQTVLEELNADTTPPVLRELKAQLKQQKLSLPIKPHQAAAIDNPKQTLDQIIRIASRRRNITRNDLYEPMDESVRLEILRRLEDYTQFVNDLTAALVIFNKVQI